MNLKVDSGMRYEDGLHQFPFIVQFLRDECKADWENEKKFLRS